MKRSLLFFFAIFIVIVPSAAQAYAGPGVAIGAIIVFFTVIFAFFASTIISSLKFTKKVFRKVFKINKRNSNKKVTTNK